MNKEEVGRPVLQIGKRLKGIEDRSAPGLVTVNKGHAGSEISQPFSHASLVARSDRHDDAIDEIATQKSLYAPGQHWASAERLELLGHHAPGA